MLNQLPILDCLNPPCGACCLHFTIPPFDCMCSLGFDGDDFEDDVDFSRLPDHLKAELVALYESDRSNLPMPCPWLDPATRKCRNYEHRPVTCREFQPGCNICLEDREIAVRDGMLTEAKC